MNINHSIEAQEITIEDACNKLERKLYETFQKFDEVIDFPETVDNNYFDKPNFVAMNGAIYQYGELLEPPVLR